MGVKHYRFMKDVPLKERVRGDMVSKGAFCAGDYLISKAEGEDLKPVRLADAPHLEDIVVAYGYFRDLLKDGVLSEVPGDIRELDWKYQDEAHKVVWLRDRTEELFSRTKNWGMDERLVKSFQAQYEALCKDLDGIEEKINAEVVEPLLEMRKQNRVDDVLENAGKHSCAERGSTFLMCEKVR